MEAYIGKVHDYTHSKFKGADDLQKDNMREDFGCTNDKNSNTSSRSKYYSGSSLTSNFLSPPLFSYHRDNFKSGFTSSSSALLSEVQQQLTSSDSESINWDALNLPHTSGIDCLMKYRNECDPNINHGKWTPAEEKNLLGAVDLFQERDWCRIADAVKGRTPMQCLQHYQLNFNKGLICPTEWSAEEDTLLMEAAALYGMCCILSCVPLFHVTFCY